MSALFALCLISVPPKIIIIIIFFLVGGGGVSFKQHELKKKIPLHPVFMVMLVTGWEDVLG